MIVFGISLSPYSRKVLTFLGEKGIAYEHRPVTPHDASPDFKAASPVGKIPALVDGDYRLSDSSAICHYLERKYPNPSLFPSSPDEVGRMLWLEEFSDTLLVPAHSKVFFQLVVQPNIFKKQPDMSIVDQALTKELPPVLTYLDSQISGPFLVGGKLSLADIAVYPPLLNLKTAGHPVDAQRYPKLSNYFAGLLARPAFAAVKYPF
jgi:glutathione S-transferase